MGKSLLMMIAAGILIGLMLPSGRQRDASSLAYRSTIWSPLICTEPMRER